MSNQNKRAGGAYLVKPDDGPGPGVLVLHSAFGLRDEVKDYCDRLADEGFTALAPDLSDGEQPETTAEALASAQETVPDAVAALILSSSVALRAHTEDESAPLAVVGFSMGASWGLWLATRAPQTVAKVVGYYGTTNLDFIGLSAPVLGHFGDDDELVGDDELTEMHAHLLLLEKEATIETYTGARHWFAEADRPEYDREFSERAWQRSVAFLRGEGYQS